MDVVEIFSSLFHGVWFQTLLGSLGFCMLSVNVQVSIVLEVFSLVTRCLKILCACIPVTSLSLTSYGRKTFASSERRVETWNCFLSIISSTCAVSPLECEGYASALSFVLHLLL